MDATTPLTLRRGEEVEGTAHLGEQLRNLQDLDLDQLRVTWRKLMRSAPPELPRYLLVRLIAYKMQARVYGDLAPETVRFLRRIEKERVRRRAEGACRPKAPPPIPPVPAYQGVKPGTVFAREFGGTVHIVTAVQEGFAWKGKTYSNLSEIARLITGTRWNGPRFFGMRESEPKTRAGRAK